MGAPRLPTSAQVGSAGGVTSPILAVLCPSHTAYTLRRAAGAPLQAAGSSSPPPSPSAPPLTHAAAAGVWPLAPSVPPATLRSC